VLDELAENLEFRLTIIGIADETASRPWLNRVSPGPDALYPRYAGWLTEQAPLFDIGVAPLVDSEFNRLKSDIKLLEYLALGIAPVMSNLDPYSDSDLALPPMLCGTPEQWLERLSTLAANHTALEEAKSRARDQREAMWRSRNAATTGTSIVNRLADLIDRAP